MIRDEKVANEEDVAYWEHRAWFEDALPVPSFYETGNQERAITWFKKDTHTTEMKNHLLFYFELAKKYGVTIAENTMDSLDGIIYEDNFQVAVIPRK